MQSFRRKIQGSELEPFLREIGSQGAAADRLAFVCIGTDRSTGDSLGPLVGTFLKEAGYTAVIGSLDRPCDSSNLELRVREVPDGRIVIAIDACLGLPISIGKYQVANMPLEPGRSMGKLLPPVGDYSIAAIVNEDGPKKYWNLQHTSLYRVMQMAREITASITRVFPPGGG